MGMTQSRVAEPRRSVEVAPDTEKPVDVVRALFDAWAAGDDHSAFATGELVPLLRLEHEAGTAVESAARTFEARRLEEVQNDGRTATVALDGETRLARKDERTGEWIPASRRLRGLAHLVNEAGRWRVSDLPTDKGRSTFSVDRRVGSSAVRDGDLELEVRVATGRSRDTYTLRMRNAGQRALTPVRVLDERRALGLIPLRMRLPFIKKQALAPGDAWTFTFAWCPPFRLGRGSVGVEAIDDAGTTHVTSVDVPAPARTLRLLLAANAVPVRLFEAIAVVFLVWGLLPDWIVTTFLPGLALVCAGVLRTSTMLHYVRYRDRGSGPVALGLVAAAEMAVGTWMVLRVDPTVHGAAIVASALALLVPTLLGFRRPA